MEELKNCPVCGNEKYTVFLNCTDYFLTKEKFTIVKCEECEFTFINPRPEIAQFAGYYESTEYISHSGTDKGIVNSVYKKVRNYTHKKKVKLVSKYAKGNKILDIGCGSGELLSLFKEHDWETLGIEPNQSAREFAIKQHGIIVEEESGISKIVTGSMDVISMWHVLEHVSGLNERLREVNRILKDDGVVFIAVPNRIAYDALYYKEFWAAYDVPRHLYHFTPDSMERLLRKHHFALISCIPMKFDSYYVSMLSEKYKSGAGNIIKALYIGLRSNLKAGNKKKNYSSMIYVVKKG
jgi:2-polyprenyl-3-methyl-5-hydroxy-6-metoxy-1,4-benzoquinol methylase